MILLIAAPQLNVVTSDFSVTITGTVSHCPTILGTMKLTPYNMQVPSDSPTFTGVNVSVSVQRSSPMTVDCGTSVASQPTNGDATVTIMDQLSCRYAGQCVTYCLQFTTDQCDSATVMESTDQCM